MIAETILLDAEVITMTRPTARSDAQAVAIAAGKIAAVGSNEEIRSMAGPGTVVQGLGGRPLLPGFIDTHVHFMQMGLGLVGPSAYGVTSADEVLAAIAQAAAARDPEEVILLHGYDAGVMDRQVTGADLDRAAPRHRAMIGDIGGHACIVNARAWEALALSPDLVGIRCDGAGKPTGLLVALANSVARYRFYGFVEDATRVEALHCAAEFTARFGITTVHALEGGSADGHGWLPERDVEVLLQERARLPIETVVYFQSTDVPRAQGWHLPRIGGCLYVDGAWGEHTAALMQPYADDPTTQGVLYFSDDELNAYVERAHLAGLQISMHAIGDAAIEQLLTAYERALARHPRSDHRHRIEHFSLPTSGHIDRVARLGVAVAMQPNFALMPDTGASDDYQFASARFVGLERFKRRHPYRRIVDAGILVAAGSDADAGEMGPMLGIQAVVNHPDAERRLTAFEAMTLYTANGARIGFEEGNKGTIEPGKRADLVVLGQNPLTADPRTLIDILVEMTVVGGRVVYEAGADAAGNGR
ncbi:MAG TPA: amidohydrolase [Anaerolineae bacterium]|nr:amidohydrolase [Anaerolineae bacterium]